MELLGCEDLAPPIHCLDLASNPWPLPDYTPSAVPFFPPFVSHAPSAASSVNLQCVSPYLLLPSITNLVAPFDFHGFYKPTYDSTQQLYQEACASSMFSGVDSQMFPCPVYAGLAQSFSYAVSSESKDGATLQSSHGVENLQVAMPSSPSLLQSHVNRAETAKQEPHSMTNCFNNTIQTSATPASSSPEAPPVPVASTSSSTWETAASTTTSIKEHDDAKCSSNLQESRAEISARTAAMTTCKNQGSKRRKAQQKRVVCVPAIGGTDKPTGECLPSDSWAWRKYGQKPIKGSPYPRGYYRCSSSKGCTARKQVERSRSDPSMLVITYTSDHNHSWPTHRNALAGTTRQASLDKRSPDSAAVPRDGSCCEVSDNPPLSSDINSPSIHEDQAVSPTATTMEGDCLLEEQGLDLDFVISDRQEDDFFAQLEELPDCWIMLKRNPLDEIADAEDGNTTIDPYNLFSWSSNSCGGMNSIW